MPNSLIAPPPFHISDTSGGEEAIKDLILIRLLLCYLHFTFLCLIIRIFPIKYVLIMIFNISSMGQTRKVNIYTISYI